MLEDYGKGSVEIAPIVCPFCTHSHTKPGDMEIFYSLNNLYIHFGVNYCLMLRYLGFESLELDFI